MRSLDFCGANRLVEDYARIYKGSAPRAATRTQPENMKGDRKKRPENDNNYVLVQSLMPCAMLCCVVAGDVLF